MLLTDILYGVGITSLVGKTDVEVTGLAFDSRKVQPGMVFIAVSGTQFDGHEFVNSSLKRGAVAVVFEKQPIDKLAGINYIEVASSAVALGIMASNFYGRPSRQLQLVGITGTNGKTTVATLLFKLFQGLGYRVGLVSTVQNHIDKKVVEATHTTPDPIALNALLKEMIDAGCSYCFMEVSSHAIVQHRISGLMFSVGIFTNISHDHLDFHRTFDNYIKAKKQFFDSLPRGTFALTNLDDKNGMVMLQNTKATGKTYSLKKIGDFKGRVIENSFNGLHMDIEGVDVFFKLVGNFNAYNLLAVYGAARLLNQDQLSVLTELSKLTGAEGRFDYFLSKNNIIGIVDYAHTPDAVQNVLSTIQEVRKGTERVITVIGCGGDRDKAKRPLMAQVACDWSDMVILTSDNPRTEDPQSIIDDMEVGVSPSNKKKTLIIVDRRSAIATACHLAKAGDVVLVAGKGHEKYQEIRGIRHYFNDREVLNEQFNLIG